MRLKKLLPDLPLNSPMKRFLGENISSICVDSRRVQPGDLFVAIQGARLDGTKFIEEAIVKGARIIVKNKGAAGPAHFSRNVCVLEVPDTRVFLKESVRRFYGNPSRKVKTIGITGTNGKTTVSYFLESIFHQAKKTCGVVGTVNYRIGRNIFPAPNTTPGLLENQQFLAKLAHQGADYCVMEVSSHALAQGRVDLIDFRTAVFTNLTSDHLDYHGNTENYFQAKARLFSILSKTATAVLNADDSHGRRLRQQTNAQVITYGIDEPADIRAMDLESTIVGSSLILKTAHEQIKLKTRLIGRHNVYNILAAAAAGWTHGISWENIRQGIEGLAGVPGRLEKIECGQPFHVFVDYAHTEDGLKNVLLSLRNVGPAKIIVVFGCGGDRDKTKRPLMGKVATQLANTVIITSDNPRSENPQTIADQITAGCEGQHHKVILDRREAVEQGFELAQPQDVVLIAGKGHENYQIFHDRTIPFDDREIARDILKRMGATKTECPSRSA